MPSYSRKDVCVGDWIEAKYFNTIITGYILEINSYGVKIHPTKNPASNSYRRNYESSAWTNSEGIAVDVFWDDRLLDPFEMFRNNHRRNNQDGVIILYENILHINRLELTRTDIKDEIELALATKDRKWFNQLTNTLKRMEMNKV